MLQDYIAHDFIEIELIWYRLKIICLQSRCSKNTRVDLLELGVIKVDIYLKLHYDWLHLFFLNTIYILARLRYNLGIYYIWHYISVSGTDSKFRILIISVLDVMQRTLNSISVTCLQLLKCANHNFSWRVIWMLYYICLCSSSQQ